MTEQHVPVLLQPVIDALLPGDTGADRIIDGTLGAGGHTRALLEAGAGYVLGLDRDPQAITLARAALVDYAGRVEIVHASYGEMKTQAARLGWDVVDGILLDLGVSSMQLDTPERGFAFMHDGPLDMRFDPTSGVSPASDLVNSLEEGELARIFTRYGEEQHSRRLARAIVAGRPYRTTRDLAGIIEAAAPRPPRGRQGRRSIHPATRIFQALRIVVNDELRTLERVLPEAVALLRPGGRLAVISFHSLEDRIVKQYFRDASTEIISPPGMMLEEKRALVRLVNRKPLAADDEEAARNPRSRSAKLRVVEKL